jgi:thiol-disulfide isomerase/thioredoxin
MRITLLRCLVAAALLAAVIVNVAGQKVKTAASSPPARSTAATAIKQIDIDGLKMLLKTDGKPRLINFWATWCDPCREEFPELVKIDKAYKGKIDFVAISLDDLEDIGTTVPKFLREMKATMPAYLLHASDEDAAIAAITNISSDFHGSLPFTILIKPNGELAYSHQGKIHMDELNAAITKQLATGP